MELKAKKVKLSKLLKASVHIDL
jgi:hypothetical protein